MKAVIDTSVFVSYLIKGRSVHIWLIDLWVKGRFSLVISRGILNEIVDVTSRAKISVQIVPESKVVLFRKFHSYATWTPGTLDCTGATPDPKDDMLVSAALEAGAAYIVTWDKALLALGSYGDVRFVDPERFVSVVLSQSAADQDAASDQYE